LEIHLLTEKYVGFSTFQTGNNIAKLLSDGTKPTLARSIRRIFENISITPYGRVSVSIKAGFFNFADG